MKHLVNPAVKAILRSRAHRILSSRLAVITFTGRRSGRRYSLPISYRQTDGTVTIGVGAPERKQWWRNLRSAGPVRLRLRGVDHEGWARATGDEGSQVVVTVELSHGSGAPPVSG